MEKGVLYFDNCQLVPLILLGFRVHPKLRDWLTKNLAFRLGLRRDDVSALCCEGGNDQHNEGKLRFGFESVLNLWFMASLLHTSQPCRVAMFVGDREGEEGLAQVFTASSRLILSGHGKPAIQAYAFYISTMLAELSVDWMFG